MKVTSLVLRFRLQLADSRNLKIPLLKFTTANLRKQIGSHGSLQVDVLSLLHTEESWR
jgi:hypothetical protein